MHPNLMTEWNIARAKRQDWLCQAEQERLVRGSKAKRGSNTKADRQWPANLRMWLVRRRAIT